MLSPATIQAALMTLLQADVPLVAALGGDPAQIKEASWRGKGFEHPAVRLDMGDHRPQGTGACAEQWLGLVGSINVFSKDSSSLECLTILGLVANAIQRKRLTGAGMTGLEIKIDQTVYPYRDGNVWRGEVVFATTAIET